MTQGNRAQADLEDGGLSGLEALRRIHAGQSAQPPIHYWSGRRLASLQHGEASISIPASGWFCDPKGRLHSGIFAFLLDTTHVDAAHRHSLHDGRAFRNGPRRTSCQRRGDHRAQPGHLYSDERNALAEGLVVDQAGHLVAHSMSRYFLSASGAVIPPRPGSEPLPRTRSPAAEQETMTAREKLTVPPENSAAWKKTIPEVPAPGLSLPSCSATVSNRSLKVRVRCSASVLSACSLCAFSVFSSCSPRRSGLERSLRAGPLEVRRTAPSAHASERTGAVALPIRFDLRGSAHGAHLLTISVRTSAARSHSGVGALSSRASAGAGTPTILLGQAPRRRGRQRPPRPGCLVPCQPVSPQAARGATCPLGSEGACAEKARAHARHGTSPRSPPCHLS